MIGNVEQHKLNIKTNVKISFNESTTFGGCCYSPFKHDSNGKLLFPLKNNEIMVKINDTYIYEYCKHKGETINLSNDELDNYIFLLQRAYETQ